MSFSYTLGFCKPLGTDQRRNISPAIHTKNLHTSSSYVALYQSFAGLYCLRSELACTSQLWLSSWEVSQKICKREPGYLGLGLGLTGIWRDGYPKTVPIPTVKKDKCARKFSLPKQPLTNRQTQTPNTRWQQIHSAHIQFIANNWLNVHAMYVHLQYVHNIIKYESTLHLPHCPRRYLCCPARKSPPQEQCQRRMI